MLDQNFSLYPKELTYIRNPEQKERYGSRKFIILHHMGIINVPPYWLYPQEKYQ